MQDFQTCRIVVVWGVLVENLAGFTLSLSFYNGIESWFARNLENLQ